MIVNFWKTQLLVVCLWILQVKGQTSYANILRIVYHGDPDFYRADCWPGYVKDEKFLSTPIPVVSCNATLFGTLTCDTWLHWSIVAFDKNGLEVPISDDNDTITNCLKKANGTMLYTMMDSVRQCLNRPSLCPITGNFDIDKCRLVLGVPKLPISKIWEIKLRFSMEGKEVFGFTLKFEIDDTELLRAKRPTAGQKNRRKQKTKS